MEDRLTAPFPTAVETPKTATCGNCRWLVPKPDAGGDCHRFPKPEPKWSDDFCGEFKAKS